jgi:uncharacterized protein YndB with AHSA1/START domain
MDKVIHHSIQLECDPHRAFELFTVKQLLEAWLVPVAEVEPTVGGRYELFWEPNDRENDSTLGCKITALVPDKLIAFEWRSPRQFKHFANAVDPLTHVVVCFIPDRQGTAVELIHSGWRGTSEWEEARLWQDRAWTLAFQALDRHVNQPAA